MVGSWLDAVRLESAFPGDPLVMCPIRRPSPLALARKAGNVYGASASIAKSPVPVDELVKAIEAFDRALPIGGPEVADRAWRDSLGYYAPKDGEEQPKIRTREESYERETVLPSLVGMSPEDALLYLAATGQAERPVPMEFARGLLAPGFDWPRTLRGLSTMRAHEAVELRDLKIDDQHQLVFGSAAMVLGKGWRQRDQALFEGYPKEESRPYDAKLCRDWTLDHDGERLVRLKPAEGAKDLDVRLPVVELSEVLPNIMSLLDQVQKQPKKLLDAGTRGLVWKSSPGHSRVARRIVEGILLEFTPWPYPFGIGPGPEKGMSLDEVRRRVTNLFERIRSAPVEGEPPDVAGHFFGYIQQGRAPLSTWPGPYAGVWGFKIRTGDHNWIKGALWNEPGVPDDPKAPLRFENQSGWESRCLILCGSLRCNIWYYK